MRKNLISLSGVEPFFVDDLPFPLRLAGLAAMKADDKDVAQLLFEAPEIRAKAHAEIVTGMLIEVSYLIAGEIELEGNALNTGTVLTREVEHEQTGQ